MVNVDNITTVQESNPESSLVKIPFADFYEEVKLTLIDDKESLILALLNFKKLSKTQIHKLIFLTFADGKIFIPFKFTKNQNGPFSEELNTSLEKLKHKNLISLTKPEKVKDYDKRCWILTEQGKTVLKENSSVIEKIKANIADVLSDHDEGASSLKRYCYKTYFLKPKEKTDAEWDVVIKNKIEDLRLLLEERKKEIESFEDLEEIKKTIILTSFDYIENLLQRLLSYNIDQVIRGVLIKNIEDYIDLWGCFLQFINKKTPLEQIETTLSDVRNVFQFINLSAESYGVFESVFQ